MIALFAYGAAWMLLTLISRRRIGADEHRRTLMHAICAIAGAAVIASLPAAILVTEVQHAVLIAALMVCTVTDLEVGAVFDAISLPALIAALALSLPNHPALSVVGACAAAGSLFALHALSGGRGLGLGDVKLGAVIGAACGIWVAAYALGVAFIAGALFGLGGMACGRLRVGTRIPFAPFLGLGTLLALEGQRWTSWQSG
jgi:prepilin signal peptidase PulO-like enzyme (type II secretory pathway)